MSAIFNSGVFKLLFSLVILLSGLWGTLALFYQAPTLNGLIPSCLLCAAWALLAVTALVLVWTRFNAKAMLAYVLAYVLLYAWWATIPPSDTRDWAPDVARHLRAEIQGSQVTLRNVRNFDWRSDTDFTERWETRQYDLNTLSSVDMAVSYWMGPAIAHTLVSFGFDDGRGGTDQLVFSVEIRKERDEAFSTIGGFFKQFELSVVAADERDVLRVRTNVRGEDVYLYRVTMDQEAAKSLFLSYLAKANALASEPRFYHTITANCTTIVYEMVSRIVRGLPLDWRLLASGYLPEYMERIGGLAATEDLATLRTAGKINERAHLADDNLDFSRLIREGVPGMD